MACEDEGVVDHAEEVPVALRDRAKPGVFELPYSPGI